MVNWINQRIERIHLYCHFNNIQIQVDIHYQFFKIPLQRRIYYVIIHSF